MVIILSLSPFRIFTIYSKQQRLIILNRCTDWLCAQTVRPILTSFKMDEIIKKSLRVMNKSEQTRACCQRVKSVCDLT